MKTLTELSNDYKQKHTVVLENNEEFDLELRFSVQQECWFYNIVYGDNFELNGQRLVTSINILRKFKNIIPFGISITTKDFSEPFLLDDFTTGRVEVNILNDQDVIDAEEEFYEQS